MAADTLSSSLNFLTDAAHLLATTAPETSAHLMSQRNSLMFNNDLQQSDVQRQHVCGCCGHIMIAGQGDVLKLEAEKAPRKKRKATEKNLARKDLSKYGCRKVFTCGACDRYTTISICPAGPIPRRRLKGRLSRPLKTVDTPLRSSYSHSPAPAPAPAPVSAPASVSGAPTNSAKATANANSKKRTKSRKQGLQALLQQSASSQQQIGFGLSLADFMEK